MQSPNVPPQGAPAFGLPPPPPPPINNQLTSPPLPPPPMMNLQAPQVKNDDLDLEASPIHDNNKFIGNDDDLDFEKEILDATSQSFLNQTGIMMESSRIMSTNLGNNSMMMNGASN